MKTFQMNVQWVSGESTDFMALDNVPGTSQSWDSYLMSGENALNFSGKDRVRFDSSPPAEIDPARGASTAGTPVWTVEGANFPAEPWLIGPDTDGDGDPSESGGDGIPLSQVPSGYRSSKGFCLTLKPDAKNKLGRFIVRVSLRVGEYQAVNSKGEPYLDIAWA